MTKFDIKNAEFETVALHGGQEVDRDTQSRGVPVYRTSSYLFKSTDHAANLFSLKESGFIYTRIGNPTQDVLERRLAQLEGGPAALALASGANAIFYSIVNICAAGDEFVSSSSLYGGTYSMFKDIFPQFNIGLKFFDINNPAEIREKITKKTKAVYIETISNPSLDVADIRSIAAIAHEHELPLIVDSTFTTPYLLKPITYGADIVIHSLTKWIGGHGTGIGGIVVDAGRFNWKNPKFTLYNVPDTGYHGMRFGHDLGELSPIAFILRMRLVPLRNLGGCISPDNAWIFLQGIETLGMRMERHSKNALAAAKYLNAHPKVAWVRYPGLPGDKTYSTAKECLDRGFGGMVVFGIKGGKENGRKFIENLALFSHLANVGDAKSLAIHPASTTHSQLGDDDLRASGITPDLIRLSIGIENVKDIINDIEQALEGVPV